MDPELPVPPLHYGGIERIVDMLARELARRGHAVTLFAHPQSTCPVPSVAWPGKRSRARLDTVRNAAVLSRYVAGGKFDVVHSFSRMAYLTPILPIALPKLMSYQRIVTPRTAALATRLSRATLEFTAVSRQMIEAVPLSGRWHLVPNGVSLGTYTYRGAVDPEAPLVFLGRMEEIKGPHLAIEVARRSGRKLVLAGNVAPEHRDWFDHHVRRHIDGDRVRFLGPVDDAQKNALLGSAVAFLMPILWDEPFGIVMVEAMACGTPVVGFHRGAVPEVVETGLTGYVVDRVDEMVRAVARVGQLSRWACRNRVERHYSAEVIAEAYLHVYSGLIHRSRPLRLPQAAN